MEDELILVDALDRAVGTAGKARVHAEGLLHRAFSVVLVREDAGGDGCELLLSRRAEGKYHSGGLWANACCSHPRAGEIVTAAAARRVREELGCAMATEDFREIGAYVYRAPFESGLCEYEYDHVVLACVTSEHVLSPDPAEVAEIRWVTPENLATELAAVPETFATWAPGVLAMALRALRPF